jgi:hypothetical protein
VPGRPPILLGDQLEDARRRDRELVASVDVPVGIDVGLPAVTDDAVLDRELGRLGRLPLTLARPDDDQRERSFLGAERSQLG